jgi:predicted metal-binding membrane protein
VAQRIGAPAGPTLLESALRSEHTVAAALLGVPLLAWLWIAAMARDMYGPMTGASAWMMTRQWDLAHLLLLWAMWAVMMIAMMLPTASPLVLLYGAAARRSEPRTASQQTYALAAGYVFTWTVFSVAATVLQRVLSEWLLVSPMMEAANDRVSGVLLLIAGAYQWTPLKHACLRTCRSPLGFLMGRWRGGASGAFRMGLEHGIFCVGCCWALMLLLFAGGVMNIAVIAGLMVWVGVEKLAPYGRIVVQVTGALMIAGGLWMLTR